MRDFKGSKNPFFGREHTKEQKDIWSKQRKDKTYEELYGEERTKEIKEKQLIKKCIPCSPEKAKKIGDAQRGSKNHMFGKKPWNFGLKATPEAIENQSKSHIGQKPWNKDIPMSEDIKEKLSKINSGKHSSPETEFKKGQVPTGKDSPFYGRPPSPKCNHGYGDWYRTPNQGIKWLRSRWEIKYAKWLDSQGILWYYEYKRFPMNIGKDSVYSPNGKDVTYCPDFYIPSENKFIEIKAYFEEGKDPKLKSDKFKSEFCRDWSYEVLMKSELINLGINLKTKEPKFIFTNKEEEEKYVKNL